MILSLFKNRERIKTTIHRMCVCVCVSVCVCVAQWVNADLEFGRR
jgi:hypothetical protein